MGYKLSTNCNKCNQPQEAYYGAWCPRCDKPEITEVKTLNLIKTLSYIEAQGHPGFKDRVWERLCDWNYIKGNDSSFTYHFEDYEEDEFSSDEDDDTDASTRRDEKLIKDTFNLGDQILFHVSW